MTMSEPSPASDYPVPLPDDRYSPVEKALIWAAIGLMLVVAAGLVLAFDTVWTETLKPIIWDPVVKDAGVAGDASNRRKQQRVRRRVHRRSGAR